MTKRTSGWSGGKGRGGPPPVIDHPRRWDLPFCRDLPDERQRREMTAADLSRLRALEPFASMSNERFPRTVPLDGILRNDTRIRSFRNGDIVVRQGDYGNSAFLILGGQVRVILAGIDPVSVGRRRRQRKSLWRSLWEVLTPPAMPEVRDPCLYPQSRKTTTPDDAAEGSIVVQDVTNILIRRPGLYHEVATSTMESGEFFGELAALGRIPRAATVAADGEAELLEIRWQGLRDLRRYDEALRAHIDDQYRRFGLAATLQASPLLAGLADKDLAAISAAAEFETYGRFDWHGTYQQLRRKGVIDPILEEPVIAEEGHYPNGLILIRAGFARLSRRYGNGERTVNYLGKGEVYGLAELVHNAAAGEAVNLGATLRAVGYVDVVRIPTRAFEKVILPALPAERIPPLARPEAGEAPAAVGGRFDPAVMEFLVENRFMNGTAAMWIDLDRCTRCDDCVRACAAGHDNNPRFLRHGRTLGRWMVANACMHCADPVCMIGCPTGAIHRDEGGGEVVINDLTCIGCGTCAASCPYDNIRMVEVRDRKRDYTVLTDPDQGKPLLKATKCDLCFDHRGGPACERACPHDALIRIDMRDRERLERWLGQ